MINLSKNTKEIVTYIYQLNIEVTKIAFIKVEKQIVETQIKDIIQRFMYHNQMIPKNPSDLETAEDELNLENIVVIPLKTGGQLEFLNTTNGLSVYKKEIKHQFRKID